MCDQSEVTYLPQEVVWVKLSSVWWPAEVQDEEKLDPDIVEGLRKKPLAIVKFFNEDSYEFIGSLNNIYRYNCFKKDEFIRKGLHMLRGLGKRDVPTNITKFPEDVAVAEKLTGGNPNIINDEKYLPEQKIDYNELFGNPKKNKTSKSGGIPSKNSPGLPFKSSEFNFSSVPGEKLNFHCDLCNFSCNLVNVVISHRRVHNNCSDPLTDWIKNGEEYSRRRSPSCVTPVVMTKLVCPKPVINKRKISKDSKKDTPAKKKKVSLPPSTSTPNVSALGKRKSLGATPTEKPRKVSKQKTEAIRNRLIKDWDIEEEDSPLNDSCSESPSQIGEPTPEPLDQSENLNETEASVNDQLDVTSESPMKNDSESKPKKVEVPDNVEKSCFDFEDNDDSINLNESMKFGQKLPRVISEKRATTEASPLKNDTETDLSSDIDKMLEETEVPELPEVPKGPPAIQSSPSSPKVTSHNDTLKTKKTFSPDKSSSVGKSDKNSSPLKKRSEALVKTGEETDSLKKPSDIIQPSPERGLAKPQAEQTEPVSGSDNNVPESQETPPSSSVLPQKGEVANKNVLNEKSDAQMIPSDAEEPNKLKEPINQSDPPPALTGSNIDEVSRPSDTIQLNNGNSEINEDINKFSDISGHGGGVNDIEGLDHSGEQRIGSIEKDDHAEENLESAEDAPVAQEEAPEVGKQVNITEESSQSNKRTEDISNNSTGDLNDCIKQTISTPSKMSTHEVTSTYSTNEDAEDKKESSATIVTSPKSANKDPELKLDSSLLEIAGLQPSSQESNKVVSLIEPLPSENFSVPAKPAPAKEAPKIASQIGCSFSVVDVESLDLDINSMPIVISDSSDDFMDVEVLSTENNVVVNCPTPVAAPPIVPIQEDTSDNTIKCTKLIYHLKTPGGNEDSDWKDKKRFLVFQNEEEEEEDDDDDDDDVQFVSATSSSGKKLDPRMPMPMGSPALKSPFVKGTVITRNSKGSRIIVTKRPGQSSVGSVSPVVPAGKYYVINRKDGRSIFIDQSITTTTVTPTGKQAFTVRPLAAAQIRKSVNSPSTRSSVILGPSSSSPSTTPVSKGKPLVSVKRPPGGISIPQTPRQSSATTPTTPISSVKAQSQPNSPRSATPLERKTRSPSSRITSNQINLPKFDVKDSKATIQVISKRQSVPQSRVVHLSPSKLKPTTPNILQKTPRIARSSNPPSISSTSPSVLSATDIKVLPGNIQSPLHNRKQGVKLVYVTLDKDKRETQKPLPAQIVTKPLMKPTLGVEQSLKLEALLRDSPKPPSKGTPNKLTNAQVNSVSKTVTRLPQKILPASPLAQKKATPRKTQPNDILAAALANSSLQLDSPESSSSDTLVISEPFSGTTLNQTDTSFTINHPIMTPLEVPSAVASNVTTVPIVGEFVGDSNLTLLNSSNQSIHLAVSNSNVVFSSPTTNLPQILTVASPIAGLNQTQSPTKLTSASLIGAQAVQSTDGTLLIVDPSGKVYSTSIATIESDNSSTLASFTSISSPTPNTNLEVVTVSTPTLSDKPKIVTEKPDTQSNITKNDNNKS